MIYSIPLHPYWEKIVDHYYDHIHWGDEPAGLHHQSMSTWLKEEYGAEVELLPHDPSTIHFDDDERRSWFLLRWA